MPITERHVPGAPQPVTSSKNQKKKRKAAAGSGNNDTSSVVIPDSKTAALVEKAPEPEDIQSGAIAPELIADTPIDEVKLSPIVDLIAKRLKATGKKIRKINTYSSVDPLILDDDQKATLGTLSVLEAVQKELLEVRKAVESHEAELSGLLAAEKMRAFKVQQTQVSEAVAASLIASKQRTSDVLNLVRLFNYLSQGDPAATSLNLSEQEINAISSAARALIGYHPEAQQAVIHTLYTENSEYEGVPLTRILEIIEAFENAPPTAPSSRANGDHAPVIIAPHEVAPRMAASNSFSFMQADELEASQEAPVTKTEPEPEPTQNDTPAEGAPTEEVPEPNQDNINWADDEGGLPSLSGLQEQFGASGSATPAEASTPVLSSVEPTPDDGFTQARGRGQRGGGRGGHRGRGDGYRGDRSRRGSFRGRGDGERGSHRRHEGGERGSYRGRGEGGERRGGRGGGERGGRGRGDRNRGAPPPTAAQMQS